jgi:excinuclease ABC subunit A
MIAKFRGRTACDQCGGTRLRPDTEHVKVGEKSIGDLLQMTIKNMYEHFLKLKIDKHDTQIASRNTIGNK